MKYLDYLQSLSISNVTFTEDQNYEYTSGTDCVIKYLAGTSYQGSFVQPIQLAIYTDDVQTARETFLAFVQTYTNTSFYDSENNYIRQSYGTPFTLSPLNPLQTNYVTQIIVSGVLIVSTNVSDIKSIQIDGAEIETTDRVLSLTGVNTLNRIGSASVRTTETNGYSLTLQFTAINKGSELNFKIRQIRKGLLSGNETFAVIITHEDNNDTESYNMKLQSAVLNSSQSGMPTISYVFVK